MAALTRPRTRSAEQLMPDSMSAIAVLSARIDTGLRPDLERPRVISGTVAAGPTRIREGHAMTHRIPWMPAGPAGPPLADAHDASQATSSRPGWNVPGRDRSGLWLRNAAAGLCVLAAAAAAVSFTAQDRMVDATRHLAAIAALEAAIPDAAALVFACLAVALALHGRRALRARALNLASVAASVFMNAIAAA